MLHINNLSFSYTGKKTKNTVHVLESISADFAPGTMYSVYGPSGAGKTTLLALLGGLEKPSSGAVLLDGKNISEIGYESLRRHHLSYIFQNYYLFPYLTSIENVVLSINDKHGSFADKKKKALTILEALGISQAECHRKVKNLSGGQQQRIAIARCIASGSDYLLADEPTGNLDQDTTASIIDVFRDLVDSKGKCIIVVTHSEYVRDKSDICFKLTDKKLIQQTK